MWKIIIILFFAFQSATVFAIQTRTDSLLLVLDKTIQRKPIYTAKKKQRIDSLRNLLRNEADLKQRYLIHEQLYNAYRRYNKYMALSIAEMKLIIAEELEDRQLKYLSKMRMVEVLGIMGMYRERLNIFEKIDRTRLDKQYWAFYYHLHLSLYLLLLENTIVESSRIIINKQINRIRNYILQLIKEGSLDYKFVRTSILVAQGRLDEALFLMNQAYERYGNNDFFLRSIAYNLAVIYEKKGNVEKTKQYLAISAIANLRQSIKGHIALRKLAVLLYKEGDTNRAYLYIKRSFEDAIFSGAQFRILEASEALSIIVAAHNRMMNESKERLLKYLILISILGIALIISIVLICIQINRLAAAKKSINNMYKDMKQTSQSLDELNQQLLESHLIKEECISSIFILCSTYIDKMESYRIQINKRIKANQIEDVRRLTSSTLIPNELKDFFGNFDAVFLNIYPKFIEQFNGFLKEEEQIRPKPGDILTPELRVYALIRLGITDSGKIATFLHYSPQTVYNYKLKIKNKLAISKKDFSIAVRKIGK